MGQFRRLRICSHLALFEGVSDSCSHLNRGFFLRGAQLLLCNRFLNFVLILTLPALFLSTLSRGLLVGLRSLSIGLLLALLYTYSGWGDHVLLLTWALSDNHSIPVDGDHTCRQLFGGGLLP